MAIRKTKSHAFWRLKQLRELKGITLEELATGTGLTKSYLSKVERGVSMPSIDTALKLSDALHLGVGQLFGVDAQGQDYAGVRKGARTPSRRKAHGAGAGLEGIAAGLPPNPCVASVPPPPHQDPEGQRRQHRGREMLFVLKGKL